MLAVPPTSCPRHELDYGASDAAINPSHNEQAAPARAADCAGRIAMPAAQSEPITTEEITLELQRVYLGQTRGAMELQVERQSG